MSNSQITLPELSTTISAEVMLDSLDLSIAALAQRVADFQATGVGTKADLKRQTERLFGARAFICNVIGPKLANGQSASSRALFDRVDDQWETLSALLRSI